jgi:hypothetical protein
MLISASKRCDGQLTSAVSAEINLFSPVAYAVYMKNVKSRVPNVNINLKN